MNRSPVRSSKQRASLVAQPVLDTSAISALKLPQPPVSPQRATPEPRHRHSKPVAGPAKSTLPCPAMQLTHVHGYSGERASTRFLLLLLNILGVGRA